VDERVQAQAEAPAHPPGTKATQPGGSEVSRRDHAQDAATAVLAFMFFFADDK
jgi:hypothetical protein